MTLNDLKFPSPGFLTCSVDQMTFLGLGEMIPIDDHTYLTVLAIVSDIRTRMTVESLLVFFVEENGKVLFDYKGIKYEVLSSTETELTFQKNETTYYLRSIAIDLNKG